MITARDLARNDVAIKRLRTEELYNYQVHTVETSTTTKELATSVKSTGLYGACSLVVD
jgi:hypothetical protein